MFFGLFKKKSSGRLIQLDRMLAELLDLEVFFYKAQNTAKNKLMITDVINLLVKAQTDLIGVKTMVQFDSSIKETCQGIDDLDASITKCTVTMQEHDVCKNDYVSISAALGSSINQAMVRFYYA